MSLSDASVIDMKAAYAAACEALIAYLANDLESNDSSNARRCEVDGVDGAYFVEDVITGPHLMKLESLVQQCVETNPKKSLGGLNFTDEKKTSQNSMRRQSQLHTPLQIPPASMRILTKIVRPFLNPTASPFNDSPLEADERGISGYLRLYDYHENEFSSPHFDKPFVDTKDGNVTRFSAYSVLLYLNDTFEGGETVFYPDVSDRLHCGKHQAQSQPAQQTEIRRTVAGNNFIESSKSSSMDDDVVASLSRVVKVSPKQGGILVFPHGRQAQCYADPYHSGGVVSNGRKTIIRTDVVYKISDAVIEARRHKFKQKEFAKRDQQSSRLGTEGAQKAQTFEKEACK